MSIRNAINLLNAVEFDEGLRAKLYECKTSEELDVCLKKLDFAFNGEEFEDAVNYLHVQCQTFESAQLLLGKAEWLRFILYTSIKATI